MNRVTLVVLALGLGCGADPAPVSAPTPQEPVVPQQPGVPFDEAAVVCCSSERVRRVVAEYLDMQRALARDDLPLVQAELQALRGVSLDAAAATDISSHSRGLAQQVAGLLEPVAGGGLEKIRGEFVEVSNKVIVLVQANQGGSKQVAVAFCPSANANWLQAEPEILNPFLGTLDPSSGSFRR